MDPIFEPTLQIDSRGRQIVIQDERAVAIRLANLFMSRRGGMPNNDDMFFDIKSYIGEQIDTTSLAMLRQAMVSAANKAVTGAPPIDIQLSMENTPGARGRSIVCNITVGDKDAITIKGISSKNGVQFSQIYM